MFEGYADSDCILTEKFITLYSSVDVKSDNVALSIILHFFMLDSGFIPKDCPKNAMFSHMPGNWMKNGILKIDYQHNCCPSSTCSMTCVPIYNVMSVHGALCDTTCSQSVNLRVEICKYLQKRRDFSNAFKTYDKYSELSRYFKDNFSLPLLNLLHESLGLPQYGFNALLDEIKVYILEFLSVESVVAMSAVNKCFYELANSNALWKHMYLRDFSADGVPDQDSGTNWKQRYQEEYAKKKRAKCRPLMIPSLRLPQIFPVGPDFGFEPPSQFLPPPLFPPFRDPHNLFSIRPHFSNFF